MHPYDDEDSLKAAICSLTEDLYPLNSQTLPVNPESNNPLPKSRFDYPQMSAPSPDIIPSTYSLGEYGSRHMGSNDVRFDQPIDFQCHVDNTLICDPGSSMHLQYLGGSSPSDLQCAVDRFLFPCSAMGKAHTRWTIVSSVVKWFSLMLEIRKGDVSTKANSRL